MFSPLGEWCLCRHSKLCLLTGNGHRVPKGTSLAIHLDLLVEEVKGDDLTREGRNRAVSAQAVSTSEVLGALLLLMSQNNGSSSVFLAHELEVHNPCGK